MSLFKGGAPTNPIANRSKDNRVTRKRKMFSQHNNTDSVGVMIVKAIDDLKLSTPTIKVLEELQDLYNILSYRRADGSTGELNIIRRYIASLPGVQRDGGGNYHLLILKPDGEPSKVMWSCHTDTVHSSKSDTDRQKLHITAKGILKLADGQHKDCLGADDGSGMWLMLQMIKNEVPGYYIFHRNEEHGRVGSRWVANNLQKECQLDSLDYSIAFDRRGETSIITHQSGSRCCSEKFVTSMAKAMEKSGIKWRSDSGGSFTDTASYTKIIKECTNLSVGYTGAHGANEEQDVIHLLKMREALITFDESVLVADRDPTKEEYRYSSGSHGATYGGHGQGYGYGYNARLYKGMNRSNYYGDVPILKDRYRMAKIIESYSLEIAELLQADGFDSDLLFDLVQEMQDENAPPPSNVVHIGSKKKAEADDKTIEQKVNEKTLPQQGPTNKPPVFKKDYMAGDKTFSNIEDGKAKSSTALLGEQIREEATKLSNEARSKALSNQYVSQTGVYCNEELMQLSTLVE